MATNDSRDSTGDLTLECMAPHPTLPNTFCAIECPKPLFEHDGPHGWDYESGEKRLVTRT